MDMKRKILMLFLCVIVSLSINAQIGVTPLEYEHARPIDPSPVYVPPMSSIYDNSTTIINNSYRPSAPRVTCIDSQKQTGQILMYDTTNDKTSVVDAEVLFKSFSNNTASITITRLKLDNKWYPMDIEVFRLSDALGDSKFDRDSILELLKSFNFFASSEKVLFLF